MSDKPTVLFVDDEPELLDGIRLSLRKSFDVVTAGSGPEGLELLAADEGDILAVVSDMRMPQMSGAEFLTTVRNLHPDLPRILLTGQADLESAIAAVNEAKIFRFLSKPCPPDTLRETLDEALEHARLRTVERDLLDRTLSGTVGMLTDVLGLVSVGAYSRTMRLVDLVNGLCAKLDREPPWDLVLAARLSQIGCVVVGDRDGERLPGTPERHHSQVAADLLANIPRLEPVARIVARQLDDGPIAPFTSPDEWNDDDLNAELLRVAVRFDEIVSAGNSRKVSLDLVAGDEAPPPPFVVDALRKVKPLPEPMVEVEVTVRQLSVGMELAQDIVTTTGSMLAADGVTLTSVLVGRILTFSEHPGLVYPLRARVPASTARDLAIKEVVSS